ncbi:hypothetical protein [Clostridium paraputrificum]|uniref:hypothetical protein n=1 Tax=Clostridium paraputrificum TaxID=29363 RepID=UPI0006DBF14A|nr:hypothetical protein [Clostridium paraputrificum]
MLINKKILEIVLDKYKNNDNSSNEGLQNYIDTLIFALKVMKNKTNKEIRKHKKSIVKATF